MSHSSSNPHSMDGEVDISEMTFKGCLLWSEGPQICVPKFNSHHGGVTRCGLWRHAYVRGCTCVNDLGSSNGLEGSILGPLLFSSTRKDSLKLPCVANRPLPHTEFNIPSFQHHMYTAVLYTVPSLRYFVMVAHTVLYSRKSQKHVD